MKTTLFQLLLSCACVRVCSDNNCVSIWQKQRARWKCPQVVSFYSRWTFFFLNPHWWPIPPRWTLCQLEQIQTSASGTSHNTSAETPPIFIGAGRPWEVRCWQNPRKRVLPVWAGRWWGWCCRCLLGRVPPPCNRSHICEEGNPQSQKNPQKLSLSCSKL